MHILRGSLCDDTRETLADAGIQNLVALGKGHLKTNLFICRRRGSMAMQYMTVLSGQSYKYDYHRIVEYPWSCTYFMDHYVMMLEN